jgi:DegV family protein with EDD domain
MTIRIVTDSTCDLPKEIIDQYNISVVPCYINSGAESFRDQIDITRHDFYSNMANLKRPLKTSAPGTGLFTKVYEQLAADGASQIISMHIHHGLSNLANAARLAAQSVNSIKVTVVEAGQLALGLGFMAMKAAQAALDNISLEKILAMIKEWEERIFVYAALDTVDYLRESGRVPNVVLKISNLLRIKPIIQLHKGEVRLIGQARTPSQSKSHLLKLMHGLEPLESIAVLHTNAEEKARQLIAEINNELNHPVDIWISEATPVLGVHVGPGGIGLACVKAAS